MMQDNSIDNLTRKIATASVSEAAKAFYKKNFR
jgi:hypothetical protein